MIARSLALALTVSVAGCGGASGDPDAGRPIDDAGSADAGAIDAASSIDGGSSVDAASAGDAATSCGSERPVLSSTSSSEGLVIARDGTIYYAVPGGVARIAPDGTVDETFLPIRPGATIWGLALDADDTHLFIGDPGRTQLRVATGLSGTPTVLPLAEIDQPNGVTLGPDGAIYVSDFGSDTVERVDPSTGAHEVITASTIAGADGVAFTDDGHLLVTSYADGTVLSLTLDATGHETARTIVATGVPSADGIAIDENGVLYVGGGSSVRRIGPGGTPDMTLQMGHAGTANLEWGAGPLDCHDLYVATGDGLTRIPLTVGQRAVPWH